MLKKTALIQWRVREIERKHFQFTSNECKPISMQVITTPVVTYDLTRSTQIIILRRNTWTE